MVFIRIFLWSSVFIAGSIYITGPVFDPDLWWHLTAGKWILAHKAVPTQDYWNLFSQGEWVAYSWLCEVIFALIDKVWGHVGLYYLKLSLSLLLGFSFGIVFYLISRSPLWSVVLGILALLSCFNHFTLRPQSFTWLYFIWLLFVLETIEREKFNISKGGALILIGCLWANTHITTIFAVGTTGLYLFDPKKIQRTVCCLLLVILGTFITPYIGKEWLVFFLKSSHPFQYQSIAEFQPATVLQHSSAFLIISLAITVVTIRSSIECLHLSKLVLLGGFTLGALAVVKFLPFAIIVSCFLTALAIGKIPRSQLEQNNLVKGIFLLEEKISSHSIKTLLLFSFCLIPIFLGYRDNFHGLKKYVPVRAVDFMIEHELPQPFLNEFAVGGYLMYRYSDDRGNPTALVSIDGRTNVTPLNVWESYKSAYVGRRDWKQYIEKVSPRTIIWQSKSPFISLLLLDDAWCDIFNPGKASSGFWIFVDRETFKKLDISVESRSC